MAAVHLGHLDLGNLSVREHSRRFRTGAHVDGDRASSDAPVTRDRLQGTSGAHGIFSTAFPRRTPTQPEPGWLRPGIEVSECANGFRRDAADFLRPFRSLWQAV